MPNELDMDSYHSEGIDPGEHKTFNISPTIHSFRNLGEAFAHIGLSKQQFEQRFRGRAEPFNPYQDQDTFEQRFQGELGQLPLKASGESFRGTPSLDRPTLQAPPAWPEEGVMGIPYLPGISEPETETESKGAQRYGGYQPIGFKETQQELHPYLKALRDAGVQYIENMSQQMKDALVDTIKHPENLIGPGELGMARARPSGFNEIRSSVEAMAKLKDLIAQGKTYSEIAAEFGVTKNKIAGLMNRVNLKGQSTHPKRTLKSYQAPEGEEPYTPPISGAKGDPEYEKTLSDWMKNQFEGGPIESEIGRNPKHWNDIEEIRGWDNEEKLLKQRQRQIQYERKLSGTQDEPSGELERIRTRLRELK